ARFGKARTQRREQGFRSHAGGGKFGCALQKITARQQTMHVLIEQLQRLRMEIGGSLALHGNSLSASGQTTGRKAAGLHILLALLHSRSTAGEPSRVSVLRRPWHHRRFVVEPEHIDPCRSTSVCVTRNGKDPAGTSTFRAVRMPLPLSAPDTPSRNTCR